MKKPINKKEILLKIQIVIVSVSIFLILSMFFFRLDCRNDKYIGTCFIKDIKNIFVKKEKNLKKDRIDIVIAPQHLADLENMQKNALNSLYFPGNDIEVPAKLIHNKNTIYKIKMRLKGDIKDHWESFDTASYKVKIKDKKNKYLNGMRGFSIQKFNRRSNAEPIFHSYHKDNNLIFLRYIPIDFYVNGIKREDYVIEESMGKELIENSKRKESVILSLDDKKFWEQANACKISDDRYWSNIEMFKLPIKFYNYKDILNSETLKFHAKEAYKLLLGFRIGVLSFEDVFDKENFLKGLGASKTLADSHAFQFTNNLKLYYNPITRKLEPIAFDHSGSFYMDKENPRLITSSIFNNYIDEFKQWLTKDKFINNLNKFGRDYGNPYYYNMYLDKINYVREHTKKGNIYNLPLVSNLDPIMDKVAPVFDDVPFLYPINLFYLASDGMKSPEVWVENTIDRKVFIKDIYLQNDDGKKVLFKNIEVDSSKTFESVLKLKLSSNINSNNLYATVYYNKENKKYEYGIQIEPLKIKKYTNLLNQYSDRVQLNIKADELYTRPVSKEELKFQPLSVEETLNYFEFLSLNENIFSVKEGKWFVEEDLIIPTGYSLEINDAILKFAKGTRLVLREAPLKLNNSTLTSINKEGWLGVVVLQSKDKSVIEGSIISNIKYIDGNLYNDDWLLTGAVTFYESDIDIIKTNFKSNNTEDLLNITLSKFLIDNSNFFNSPSDAFDGDFSKGKIINSTFNNITGDAIDISGSELIVKNTSVKNVTDKAFSIGENSYFIGDNIIVKNAGAGLVVKDASEGSIYNSSFENIKQTVLMSFVKKEEYEYLGPPILKAYNINTKDIKKLYDVDSKSELFIDYKRQKKTKIKTDELYKSGIFKKIKW